MLGLFIVGDTIGFFVGDSVRLVVGDTVGLVVGLCGKMNKNEKLRVGHIIMVREV